MRKLVSLIALAFVPGAIPQQNPSPPSLIEDALAATVSPATGVEGAKVNVRNVSTKPITAFCTNLTWHYASGQVAEDGLCSDLALGLALDAVSGATRGGGDKTFGPNETQSLLFLSRVGEDGSPPLFATAKPTAAIFADLTAVGDTKAVRAMASSRRSEGIELQQLVQRLKTIASDPDPRRAMQVHLGEVAGLRARARNSVAEAQMFSRLETHLNQMRDMLQLGPQAFDMVLKAYAAQASFLTEHSNVKVGRDQQ